MRFAFYAPGFALQTAPSCDDTRIARPPRGELTGRSRRPPADLASIDGATIEPRGLSLAPILTQTRRYLCPLRQRGGSARRPLKQSAKLVAGVHNRKPPNRIQASKVVDLTAELLWLRGLAAAYTDRAVHRGCVTAESTSASRKGAWQYTSPPFLSLSPDDLFEVARPSSTEGLIGRESGLGGSRPPSRHAVTGARQVSRGRELLSRQLSAQT
jgi:hypothetical protein